MIQVFSAEITAKEMIAIELGTELGRETRGLFAEIELEPGWSDENRAMARTIITLEMEKAVIRGKVLVRKEAQRVGNTEGEIDRMVIAFFEAFRAQLDAAE